jgi:hypothetical protein
MADESRRTAAFGTQDIFNEVLSRDFAQGNILEFDPGNTPTQNVMLRIGEVAGVRDKIREQLDDPRKQQALEQLGTDIEELRGRIDEVLNLEVPGGKVARRLDKIFGGGGQEILEAQIKNKLIGKQVTELGRLLQEHRLLSQPGEVETDMMSKVLDDFFSQAETAQRARPAEMLRQAAARGEVVISDYMNDLWEAGVEDIKFPEDVIISKEEQEPWKRLNRIMTESTLSAVKEDPAVLDTMGRLGLATSKEIEMIRAVAASTPEEDDEPLVAGEYTFPGSPSNHKSTQMWSRFLKERLAMFQELMGKTPHASEDMLFGGRVVEAKADERDIADNPMLWADANRMTAGAFGNHPSLMAMLRWRLPSETYSRAFGAQGGILSDQEKNRQINELRNLVMGGEGAGKESPSPD